MAIVDYGALLRVNGKFINYNKGIFTEIVYPKGDIPEIAQYFYNGETREKPIKGNYFVYAGDTTFMLAFYKRMFDVISDGKMIKSVWGTPFLSETIIVNGIPITVSHLDKTYITESKETTEPWNEYVKNNWQGATGKEHLWELEKGAFYYRKYIRLAKRRYKCKAFKYLTDRYIAEWDYDGNHYEVIYGYGIDPQKDVWDSIKNEWNFTEKEKEIIDTWFVTEGKSHE